MNLPNASQKMDRREMLLRSAQCTVGAALLGAGIQQTSVVAAEGKSGKRIGFVDLNLENYHANVFLQALRGPLAARGYLLGGCWGLKEAEGKAWAAKNQVPHFRELAELDRHVEYYMVLAPSNPEVHRELCEVVLPFGKPTYVDKTFAPDLETARHLFKLADKHGTPMQTSSALRYTEVQKKAALAGAGAVRHMMTWGGGGSYAEYVIHPLELLISVMGPRVTQIMRRGADESAQLLIDFEGQRTGVVNVLPKTETPFAASWTTDRRTDYLVVDSSKIFVDNLSAILDFFEARRPNVDRAESLAIMAIMEAARQVGARTGFVRVG